MTTLFNGFLVLCSVFFIVDSSLFCYWNTGCKYRYFSSKTPYELIRGDLRDSVIKIKGCTPLSIWGMIRHGKRYPGPEYGSEMKKAIKLRKQIAESKAIRNSSLCAQDVENLLNWNLDANLFAQPNALTKEGYEETMGIAKRLKESYPEYISTLDQGSYKIRPAFGNYIEKSAEGFVKGLGSFETKIKIDEHLTSFDYISPYSRCGKYLEEVRRNSKTFKQSDSYQKNPEFLAMKDRIQRRTGLQYDLTHANITALYDLCRYTTTGNNFSPWCAIFTTDDLMILEYESDLRHFYRNGYGHQWNVELGASPLGDLYNSFVDAKNGKGNKLTAYFSHASMLDMMYSAMGLFEDREPLTASKRVKDRKWRSSETSTFASNMFAILNRCENDSETQYNVIFYINERPLTILCEGAICTWEEFVRKFEGFSKKKIEFCEYEAPLKQL